VESNNKNGYFYANYNASAATPYATIGGWNASANNFVSTNFNQGGVTIGQPLPAAPGALNIDTSNSRNNALVNINQSAGFGDIFTASQGGTTKFVINNNGNLQFTGNNSFLTTITSAATAARTLTIPNSGASDSFCLQTAGNCSGGATQN